MTIKYQVESSNLTDVCLFSSYSFSGTVEEYVFYYLGAIQKAGFSIVFITTSPLNENCTARLSQFCFTIIERENKCPDFGSWKAGLSILKWGKKLNSVLLANDSVFGPFYDLTSIISSMKNRYDVWGMTDSHEIEYHLQSYFLYFNKAAIDSKIFSKFWKSIDLAATKEEVIHKYEVGLSVLFRQHNFNIGAYASIDLLAQKAIHGHSVINPTLVFWKPMIQAHGFPFLKRELIIKRHISKTYSNVGLIINVGSWKKTIEQNSTYPVKLITEFTKNYYQRIKSTNSNLCLQKRKILFLVESAENTDQQKILINFLQWLSEESDISAEIILCRESDNELSTTFARYGVVTNFPSLSHPEKVRLKERLVDEISLIVSNTLLSVDVLKYFSFLNVSQILLVPDLMPPFPGSLLMENNITWLRNNITHFIAGSETTRKQIIKLIEIPDEKVELIYKFINDEPTRPFEKPVRTIKSDLGISENSLVVGMLGKFEWKNAAHLLPVIAAAICRDKDIHIIWLGADSSSPLYQSVQTDLLRLDLMEKVHFLKLKDNRQPYFSLFDIVLTYPYENNFPLAFLECGLAGIPAISFQHEQGVCEHTRLGIAEAVPYPDFTLLREKIWAYHESRERFEKQKKDIANKIRENFTTAVQAPKLLKVINDYFDEDELSLSENPPVTFMTHIYYEDSWDEIKNKLKQFGNSKNHFLFSISEACLVKNEIIEDIKATFNNAHSLITSNIGKDIGGKMALIDLYLFLDIKSTYVVFLHDKQSPHSIKGESWKNDLFKIIDPNNQHLILSLFKDPKTGIVGAKEHIINEYNSKTSTFSNNNNLSKKLLGRFDISIENYDFLGGSMYWLRSAIIEAFFTKNHPILMRENLEAGNVLDLHEEKMAHTWERMFSWITTNEGYTIKGI